MSTRTISINLGPGGGFAGLLTILFVGLKLGHVIAWPWLWVLSPLWIGFVAVLALFVLFLVVGGIIAFFASR